VALALAGILCLSCVTPPARPLAVTVGPGVSGLGALAADGDVLYGLSSDDSAVLFAFSLPDAAAAPKAATPLGALGLGDVKARRIAAAGGKVFVAAGEKGVIVVDAKDPARMKAAGSLSAGGAPARSVLAADGRLYAGFDGRLAVYDTASPRLPSRLAEVPVAGTPYDLAVDGKRLYAALWRGGAAVFDLRPGSAPVPAGRLDVKGAPVAVAAKGGRVYLADAFRGLQTAEVSGRGPWRAVDVFSTNNLDGPLALGDGFLLAGSASGRGVFVFSTADPAKPKLAGLFRGGFRERIRDLAVAGNTAFAAWNGASLLVFDPSKAKGTPGDYPSFDFSEGLGPEKRATLYLPGGLAVDSVDGGDVSDGFRPDDDFADEADREIYRTWFSPGRRRIGLAVLGVSGNTIRRSDLETVFEEGGEYAVVSEGKYLRIVPVREPDLSPSSP